ncbi:MAG: hypothetical protein LBB60_10595 [Desulfovibrio sp.]|jgi:hypothetical protein|nr:hypothetical protein [Desulfovibrio sp.]
MDVGRTEIINNALLYMGQDTILDPDDESKNAKLCSQVYDSVLKSLLGGHPWSFAMTVAQLNELAEKPRDRRFRKMYELPGDLGSIVSVEVIGERASNWWETKEFEWPSSINGIANTIPPATYIVYGKKLLCNEGPRLQIVYIRDEVTSYEMTPQFRDYFAAMIAARLYYKVTGSRDGEKLHANQVVMLEMIARGCDGRQTDTMPQNMPDLLTNTRWY